MKKHYKVSKNNYDNDIPDGEYIKLDEGEQIITWHKVNDGLPEKSGNYLVIINRLSLMNGERRNDYYIVDYGIYNDDGNRKFFHVECDNIIKWAELPKEG